MLIAAILIELIGIAIVSTGIGMEIARGGEIYLAVITTGSCLVALGGILFGKFFKVRRP
jgi:hypothetical protein